ncbi:hypothetical protein CDV36_000647 [Fusarium kuroshium]|uniref:Splicing factor 1 helix-hairpin domain-containing protein n=1 Tax=Fusarium kuroshium TaxID=2010991 RepID=A0A3M2SQP7_9HYPO|nr:hypothetical protein CDV36_000647 [Fusarium kuroshium]
MTSKQFDAHVVIFRIDEITEQLRSERLDSTNRPWSPSPQPEHESNGREALHCPITADSQNKVDKARKIIQDVIETATPTSKHANKRKVHQLRDLTSMNSTFWDNESQYHREHISRLLEAPQDDQPATNSYRHPIPQNNGPALHQEYQQFRDGA